MEEKYIYRVKTEVEATNEFGRDWRECLNYGWEPEMDVLLGKKLDDSDAEEYENDGEIEMYIGGNYFCLNHEMIIKIMGDDDSFSMNIQQAGIKHSLIHDDDTYPHLDSNN